MREPTCHIHLSVKEKAPTYVQNQTLHIPFQTCPLAAFFVSDNNNSILLVTWVKKFSVIRLSLVLRPHMQSIAKFYQLCFQNLLRSQLHVTIPTWTLVQATISLHWGYSNRQEPPAWPLSLFSV